MPILVSIGPAVEEKSCHKLNMNDKEKRSIMTYLKVSFCCFVPVTEDIFQFIRQGLYGTALHPAVQFNHVTWYFFYVLFSMAALVWTACLKF